MDMNQIFHPMSGLFRHSHTGAGKAHKRHSVRAAVPWLFCAPSLLGLCVFTLFPFADAVRRGFTDAMGARFLGLANYRSVLQNAAFRLAAANTARF